MLPKVILFILFFFNYHLYGETLILKSGKTIEGKIIQKDEKMILVVEKNSNIVTYYPVEEISSIDGKSESTSPTEWKTQFYGQFKTDIAYADNALLSYGTESLQSPTTAKRQVMARDTNARWGITANTTNVGYKVNYGDKLKGTVYVDFIDLSQSNSIVNVKPRLMVGMGEYQPNKYFSIFAGQGFDIFSPLIPHTFNSAGLLNESGNMGFTRQQAGVKFFYKDITISIAAGNPNVNFGKPTPSLETEFNKLPVASSSIKYSIDKISFYISAMTVDLKVRQPLIDSNRNNLLLRYDLANSNESNTFLPAYKLGGDGPTTVKAGGYSFGWEIPFDKWEIKGEINYGQNISNIAASGISAIQSTNYKEILAHSNLGILTTNNPYLQQVKNYNQPIFLSIFELGGWTSIQYSITPEINLGIHGSASKVLNPEDLTSSTNTSSLFKSQPESSSGFWYNNSITGGIRESSTKGYRLSYSPETKITFFWQHDLMQTFYKDADREKGLLAYIGSYDLETGVITPQSVPFSYLKSSGKAMSNSIRLGMMIRF